MKYLILLIFLSISGWSVAQDNRHPIDIKNGDCLTNATPTTIGSIQCEQQALEAWKEELTVVLTRIKETGKLIDQSLLQESQSKWLDFHKSSVNFYYAYYQAYYQGGTLARAAAVSYEKRELRERVLYLIEFESDIRGQ